MPNTESFALFISQHLNQLQCFPEVHTPSGPREVSEQERKVSRPSPLWDPATGFWAAAEDQGNRQSLTKNEDPDLNHWLKE